MFHVSVIAQALTGEAGEVGRVRAEVKKKVSAIAGRPTRDILWSVLTSGGRQCERTLVQREVGKRVRYKEGALDRYPERASEKSKQGFETYGLCALAPDAKLLVRFQGLLFELIRCVTLISESVVRSVKVFIHRQWSGPSSLVTTA